MRAEITRKVRRLIRLHIPTLLDLSSGFTGVFPSESDNRIFADAVAAWIDEFIRIRSSSTAAVDRWHSARLRLRYLEFVASSLYLSEFSDDETLTFDSSAPSDLSPGITESAPWWQQLQQLAKTLNSPYRRCYKERLLLCHLEFQQQLTCLARQSERTGKAELFVDKMQTSLERQMHERGIAREILTEI